MEMIMRDDQMDRVIKALSNLKEVDITIRQAAHLIANAVDRNTAAVKEQTALMTDEMKEQLFQQIIMRMEMEARGNGLIVPEPHPFTVGER